MRNNPDPEHFNWLEVLNAVQNEIYGANPKKTLEIIIEYLCEHYNYNVEDMKESEEDPEIENKRFKKAINEIAAWSPDVNGNNFLHFIALYNPILASFLYSLEILIPRQLLFAKNSNGLTPLQCAFYPELPRNNDGQYYYCRDIVYNPSLSVSPYNLSEFVELYSETGTLNTELFPDKTVAQYLLDQAYADESYHRAILQKFKPHNSKNSESDEKNNEQLFGTSVSGCS